MLRMKGEMMDNVNCLYCGWNSLVEKGSDICPNCGSTRLQWLVGQQQTVRVEETIPFSIEEITYMIKTLLLKIDDLRSDLDSAIYLKAREPDNDRLPVVIRQLHHDINMNNQLLNRLNAEERGID